MLNLKFWLAYFPTGCQQRTQWPYQYGHPWGLHTVSIVQSHPHVGPSDQLRGENGYYKVVIRCNNAEQECIVSLVAIGEIVVTVGGFP